MTPPPLRVVLIGLGRIAVSYSLDEKTRRHFEFVTHADVLTANSRLQCVGAADVSPERRAEFSARFPEVGLVAESVADLAVAKPDIAVIATPAAERAAVLASLGPVKAVLLEKPVSGDLATARSIVDRCSRDGVAVQVNYWRRADRVLRELADGGLSRLVGEVQTASCVYGGGLRNNGVHLVDMARMLLGEVSTVRAFARRGQADRADPHFIAEFAAGLTCTFLPLDFAHYRELSLDIWGTDGRITIAQEGLRIRLTRRAPHRALEGAEEIADDRPEWLETGAGTALNDMYDNLVAHLRSGADLWSPGRSALASEAVARAAEESFAQGGAVIRIDPASL